LRGPQTENRKWNRGEDAVHGPQEIQSRTPQGERENWRETRQREDLGAEQFVGTKKRGGDVVVWESKEGKGL